MNCRLSKTEINSFRTNVVCLKLISDTDIRYAPIKWTCDSDILSIREFSGTGEFDFSDGILITLDRVGEATVTATLDGTSYECRVRIREPKRAKKEDKLNFYIGDFHCHSSWDHTKDGFPRRTSGFPIDIINSTRKDGRLDFTVLTDHTSIMQNTDIFRAFYDEDSADCGDLVVFPGSEPQCDEKYFDHFGMPRRESGDFLLINSAETIHAQKYTEVDALLARNPYAIVSIVHPGTWGLVNGIGSHSSPHVSGADAIPNWKRAARLIEMGNGSDRGTTMLFESTYPLALDKGFKVSPLCPSDSHGYVPTTVDEREWGYDAWPGKAVFMAPEKSKEYFLDAILNNRTYGTESGNTALYYTVNEGRCGDTLALTNVYNFHVEVGKIKPELAETPVRCEVISDYGRCVKVIENVDFSSFDFTLTSDTARYFFLRIVNADGLKTWSAPVWTGRAPDEEDLGLSLVPIDTSSFTVTDKGGRDASILVREDPRSYWVSSDSTDTLTVDCGESRDFCAIRLNVPIYDYASIRKNKEPEQPIIATYPKEFRLSISEDGENYTEIYEGIFFTYGVARLAHLGKQRARFLKLELISTVGKYSHRPLYRDAKISLGHIELLA